MPDKDIKAEIKGCLRSIRFGACADPFIRYQEGIISKGRLLEIITNELDEYFDIKEKEGDGTE